MVCGWCKSMSWSEDTILGTAVVPGVGIVGVVAGGAEVPGETWQSLGQQ